MFSTYFLWLMFFPACFSVASCTSLLRPYVTYQSPPLLSLCCLVDIRRFVTANASAPPTRRKKTSIVKCCWLILFLECSVDFRLSLRFLDDILCPVIPIIIHPSVRFPSMALLVRKSLGSSSWISMFQLYGLQDSCWVRRGPEKSWKAAETSFVLPTILSFSCQFPGSSSLAWSISFSPISRNSSLSIIIFCLLSLSRGKFSCMKASFQKNLSSKRHFTPSQSFFLKSSDEIWQLIHEVVGCNKSLDIPRKISLLQNFYCGYLFELQ